MEIVNYEESLRGVICTRKVTGSRQPVLTHQLCVREITLLTVALFELSQSLHRESQNTKDTGIQGPFVV